MTPTLYVMIGPAGSGKTTFAKSIRGADVISTDQFDEIVVVNGWKEKK